MKEKLSLLRNPDKCFLRYHDKLIITRPKDCKQ